MSKCVTVSCTWIFDWPFLHFSVPSSPQISSSAELASFSLFFTQTPTCEDVATESFFFVKRSACSKLQENNVKMSPLPSSSSEIPLSLRYRSSEPSAVPWDPVPSPTRRQAISVLLFESWPVPVRRLGPQQIFRNHLPCKAFLSG